MIIDAFERNPNLMPERCVTLTGQEGRISIGAYLRLMVQTSPFGNTGPNSQFTLLLRNFEKRLRANNASAQRHAELERTQRLTASAAANAANAVANAMAEAAAASASTAAAAAAAAALADAAAVTLGREERRAEAVELAYEKFNALGNVKRYTEGNHGHSLFSSGGAGDDDDDDVQIGDATVSLHCPLSQQRIETPMRADRCRHAACIDLRSFLQTHDATINYHMPEKNTLRREFYLQPFKCPICLEERRFHEVYVDGDMVDLLRKAPSDAMSVNVNLATREIVRPRAAAAAGPSTASSNTAADVVDLDHVVEGESSAMPITVD